MFRSHKKSSRRSSSPSSDENDRRVQKEKKSSSSRRSRSRSRDHKSSRHEKPSTSVAKSSKDKKKKSKRSSSSSSSSSTSSVSSSGSVKLLQRLEAARLKDVLERKRQKEAAKALETPEEKRARRLREKQAKEVKRRERMGWDTEYQHYTNQDNPFGDAHLTSTFVWSAKLEKKGMANIPTEELEIINRQKQLENKAELEKVKKRRQERELEKMQREEEMVLLQRSRETAQFEEWERQEDQFHLEQARLRSKIRIQDGRAKPIDLLAQYISNQGLEESIEMQMHEPYTYLNGLGVQDLEDLLEDIRVYIELDKSNDNNEYWEDLTTIVRDELHKLRKLELGGEYNATVGNREGIHQSVARDVTEIFRGKSAQQLDELKAKIEQKIESKSDGVDVGYWESLLSQLKAHMARARLKDKHQENLRAKLEMLKQEQSEAMELEMAGGNEDEDVEAGTSRHSGDDTIRDPEDEAKDILSNCFLQYTQGNYSPKYLREDELDAGIPVIDDQELDENMEKVRNRILNRGDDEEEGDFATKEEIRMAKDCRKGMNADEAEFAVETKLDSEVYLWSDKYRPRKPRYFNRVHTGFEWNKYNQTHYDMDNPPPKIVQGYKFNIFYPDLIDKSTTPGYSLVSGGTDGAFDQKIHSIRFTNIFRSIFQTPCPENKDFAILRFHSGPPYEDLAFKIVNREWEYSYKRGFRCQFHNNIQQLWFHFKRYRYRR